MCLVPTFGWVDGCLLTDPVIFRQYMVHNGVSKLTRLLCYESFGCRHMKIFIAVAIYLVGILKFK